MSNQSKKKNKSVARPSFNWRKILKSSPGNILFEKIESRMPYVGKKQESGLIESPSKTLHQELNYAGFKKAAFQSEEDCAAIMFGLSGINWFCKNVVGILFDYNYPDVTWKITDSSQEIIEKLSNALKVTTTTEYLFEKKEHFSDEQLRLLDPSSEMMYAYHCLRAVLNLRKMMRLGVSVGEIKTDKNPEEYNSPVKHEFGYLFFTDVDYDALSFLAWMKKNSYVIPDELLFYKNDQGQLEYGKQKISLEEFINFLAKEIPILWKLTVKRVKENYEIENDKKIKVEDISKEMYYIASLEVYDENFFHLKRKYLNSVDIYKPSDQTPRDVASNVLNKAIINNQEIKDKHSLTKSQCYELYRQLVKKQL